MEISEAIRVLAVINRPFRSRHYTQTYLVNPLSK